MKVFIIFWGLLIVNISFVVYQGDMSRYVQAQVFLKAIAEECAAGSALYFNQEEYSDGRFIFNYDEGRKYTEYIIGESQKRMPFVKGSIVSYDIHFQDDLQGYEDNDGNRLSGRKEVPSVTVELKVDTEDMFRLPFLEICHVTRMAKYELPEL